LIVADGDGRRPTPIDDDLIDRMRMKWDTVAGCDLLDDHAERTNVGVRECLPSALRAMIVGVSNHRFQARFLHDPHSSLPSVVGVERT
jgi:hypothetical protein